MLPIIQLGPIALQIPGLITIIGIWIGLNLAEKHAYKFGTDQNIIYSLVLTSLISGIIGARLIFILMNLEAFRNAPLNLISLNPGLFDPFGGLASGLVAGFIYANRKQLPLRSTLDALTPFFSVSAIAFSLSNLASGKAFGIETNLPWGIELWGIKRHPSQIYDVVSFSILLVIVLSINNDLNSDYLRPGRTFSLFLVLGSMSQLFLGSFRETNLFLFGDFRTVQIFAWIVLAIGLWDLWKSKEKPDEKGD